MGTEEFKVSFKRILFSKREESGKLEEIMIV